MGSTRWHWLDDGVLPLCVATLRACALWPWLELLRRWLAPSQPAPALPLLLMVGLALAGAVTARRSLAAQSSLLRARLVVAVSGLAAILAVLWWRFHGVAAPPWSPQWLAATGHWLARWDTEVPAPFLVILAVAYLWLRGILDGRRRLNSDDAWGAFVGGFIALAVAAVASNLDGQGAPSGTLTVVLLFFAAGMAALAATGLQGAPGLALSRAEASLATNRYWLGSVVLVIGGLLALGVALSLFIAPESIAQALRWTSAILDVLGRLLYYLLLAFSYLLFLVLEPLIVALQNMLRSNAPQEPPQVPDLQRQLEELGKTVQAREPVPGPDLRWLAVTALVVVIGILFALALRRFRRNGEDEVEETRETVLTRGLLEEQLAALWRRWARRLKRARMHAVERYLSLDGELPTRRVVRATYQAFLSLTGSLGYLHSRQQTPAEFQQVLAKAFPGEATALNTITSTYERARYASEPPTQEDAGEVRRAWEGLGGALQAPGGEEPGKD